MGFCQEIIHICYFLKKKAAILKILNKYFNAFYLRFDEIYFFLFEENNPYFV